MFIFFAGINLLSCICLFFKLAEPTKQPKQTGHLGL